MWSQLIWWCLCGKVLNDRISLKINIGLFVWSIHSCISFDEFFFSRFMSISSNLLLGYPLIFFNVCEPGISNLCFLSFFFFFCLVKSYGLAGLVKEICFWYGWLFSILLIFFSICIISFFLLSWHFICSSFPAFLQWKFISSNFKLYFVIYLLINMSTYISF